MQIPVKVPGQKWIIKRNGGWSAPTLTANHSKDECEVLVDWPNTASTLPRTDPTLTTSLFSSSFVCDFDPLILPFQPPQFPVCFFFPPPHMQLQAEPVKIIQDENVSTYPTCNCTVSYRRHFTVGNEPSLLTDVDFFFLPLLCQFLSFHACLHPSVHPCIHTILICLPVQPSTILYLSVYIPVCLM